MKNYQHKDVCFNPNSTINFFHLLYINYKYNLIVLTQRKIFEYRIQYMLWNTIPSFMFTLMSDNIYVLFILTLMNFDRFNRIHIIMYIQIICLISCQITFIIDQLFHIKFKILQWNYKPNIFMDIQIHTHKIHSNSVPKRITSMVPV